MIDIGSGQDKKYLLGVVGDVRSLAGFWQVLDERSGADVLAAMGLVAAALPEAETPPGRLEMGIGVPVYSGFREMLYMHPEINIVIETTGERALIRAIRKALPEHVTLVERAAASFFMNLLTSDQLCTACKLDTVQTQTMLSAVIDQLKEDILFLDAEGVVMNVNQTLVNRTGVGKREIVGRPYTDFFSTPPEGDPFEAAAATGQPAEALCSEVDEAGRMRHHRLHMYPIINAGRLSRMVAMRRDITKRTELEQRLQQSRKLASIGELSTYIAHEIRNPVFAISGFANSLLREQDTSDSAREKLKIILAESRRLDSILKAIINFTRPVDAAPGATDLAAVAREALDAVLDGHDHAQTIRTRLELDPGVPRVSIDPELLKQCLINIVKNAAEAMETGGTLTLASRLEGDQVVLDVTDTGRGIPAADREEIFNPFFSTKGKGAGLGLAMVRRIMDNTGGEVRLTSREGGPTTITLLLPPVLAVAHSGETA